MKKPVVLYSIQSYLAYFINTKYYCGKHYVWCAPYFDSNREAALMPKLAYTSNPIDILKAFYKDITIHDRHYKDSEIKRNTVGLLKGASTMHSKGVIDDDTLSKIKKIIHQCSKDEKKAEYFRPLIYVIPYTANQSLIKEVTPRRRAAALSPEYLIEALPADNFSIIDLGEEGIK